ncbi:MAG: MotA/TolQ/ExbB proton channel family protein [Planctomycetes bacterium]|nr:MotA/TolQ/ExbB proton channel family protein [Planctomycetota bacterium]
MTRPISFLPLALCSLLLIAAAPISAADAASAAKSLSVFDLYMHSMPVGGLLTILSFICFSLAFTWTFTMKLEDLVPPHLPEEINGILSQGVTDEAVEQALQVAQSSPTMLGNVLAGALAKKDFGYEAMVEAAEEVGLAEHTKYTNKVSWLGLFSSSATLLGLLGTVSGIIGSFLKMAANPGGVDPNMLAMNIGEALVCTFMGLFIAIVGLYFFFFLRNRVNQAALDTAVYTKEILNYFRPQQ